MMIADGRNHVKAENSYLCIATFSYGFRQERSRTRAHPRVAGYPLPIAQDTPWGYMRAGYPLGVCAGGGGRDQRSSGRERRPRHNAQFPQLQSFLKTTCRKHCKLRAGFIANFTQYALQIAYYFAGSPYNAQHTIIPLYPYSTPTDL